MKKINLDNRQGDVGLVRLDGKPEGLGKPVAKKKITLAMGETTGHNHILEGAVAEFALGNERVIWVEAPAQLYHTSGEWPDHKPHVVQTGWYVVPVQLEYDEEAYRRSLD